jgi:hypothetical protein
MKAKLLAALLLSTVAVTAADATVYTSTRTVGTATAQLSITTDGKIGMLAAANILDFTITLTNGSVTTTLFGPAGEQNASAQISGPAFTATATQLLFNFDVPGNNYALFIGDLDIGRPSYCLQTNFCWDNNGGGEIINAGPNFSSFQVGRRSGTEVIASTAAAVPEPATWAMMIAGFGLGGAGMRARRRTIAFA